MLIGDAKKSILKKNLKNCSVAKVCVAQLLKVVVVNFSDDRVPQNEVITFSFEAFLNKNP